MTIAGIIAGVLAAIYGFLMVLSGATSDSPSEGDKAGKRGCIIALCGVALVIGCVVWMAV